MRALSLLLALSILAACAPDRVEAPEPDAAFTARAVGYLDGLQGPSIAGDREYCGYFGYDAAGDFAASGPFEGGEDYCDAALPRDLDVVASYHTHGSYGVEYDAEVPSPEDVDTDVAEGVFGYVATPGGRVWLIDWRTGTATQVCGVACVTQDPAFDAREAGTVGRVYSRASLAARFGY
ncbi:MAG: DUF4329 domain-containing protein [Paracoccaceae bacterium]|nr:DUF4329 domain-containing protein [Paracoccaceae bacterium]